MVFSAHGETMRRLIAGFEALSPVSGDRRRSMWIGLLLTLACMVATTAWRLGPLSQWAPDTGAYQSRGVPVMTTLDAYYTLRIARLQAQGRFVAHGPAPERHYERPEQGRPGEWYQQREPKQLPGPSALLAALSTTFGVDIDRAALLLPPLLSGLFMLPLFLCAFRLGVPAAGVLAGLVTTCSIDYLQRTSLGWMDTDALNLFFPWTVTAVILFMSGERSRQHLLVMSAVAGAVMYLFSRWYPKPAMALLFALALLGHLRLNHVPWPRALACMATFLVMSGPAPLVHAASQLHEFAQRYLATGVSALGMARPAGALEFPPVWPTISEAQHLPWAQTLQQVVRRADLGIVGLLGLLPLLLARWRSMVALAPMAALGLMALVSSRRFTPYLAPFVGLGWGVLLGLLVAQTWRRWAPVGMGPASGLRASAAGGLVVVALYGLALSPAAWKQVQPQPAVPVPVFASLQDLPARLPAGSRLWTWWDLGFAIVDTTGFGVYHDGSAQYTPQTHLVATSLTQPDPALLADLMRFVDEAGNRGIVRLAERSADEAALLAQIQARPRAARPATEPPLHVLFTSDLMLKFGTLQSLRPRARGAGPPREGSVQWLDCQRLVDATLHCGPRQIDLGTGAVRLEGRLVGRLRRSLAVADGQVQSEIDHGATASGEAEATVEVVREGGQVRAVYLLDEVAWRSTLNQMFVLGRHDRQRFEEVVNRAPYARVYRLLQP